MSPDRENIIHVEMAFIPEGKSGSLNAWGALLHSLTLLH